jgi:O-acetyl-ADP-ribose deacetylase (regulator of RNase III)
MTRIRVREGDITTFGGDAIVNAANNYLQLGAGVAGAIRRAGGPSIQEECDRHGPIAVGEAAITGAGNLPVRFVIHAAAMGDQPVSRDSIRRSTLASLVLASENDVAQLAVPVLGSGVGGFEFGRAAEIMLGAIRESPHARAIDEIVFYGYTTQAAETLEQLVG